MSATNITVRVTGQTRLSPLRELPQYGSLLYFLVWRDVKVRYKQTMLGVMWSLLQPLGMIVAASMVLGSVLAPAGVPYSLFVAAGAVPWLFFARSVTDAAASVVENERILTKVYFPRVLLPLSAICAALVEALLGVGVIVLLAAAYGVSSWRLLIVAPALLIVLLTALGLGAAAAALNVRYRDARYIIPFFVQMAFLVTPVLYSSSVVPPLWRPLLLVNPLTGALDAIRWSMFGGGGVPASALVGAGMSIVIAVSGVWMFRAGEDRFADVI